MLIRRSWIRENSGPAAFEFWRIQLRTRFSRYSNAPQPPRGGRPRLAELNEERSGRSLSAGIRRADRFRQEPIQRSDVHRFDQMVIETRFPRSATVIDLSPAGERHDDHVLGP